MLWGALVLITLAVARITRFVVADALMLSFRRWVINRWGDESPAAYLVHCVWCSSIWIAFPGAVLWGVLLLPLHLWWLIIAAWLAISYVAGLLSQLEER